MVASDYLFDLPLRTEAELKVFVNKAWGVDIPDVQVCQTHSTPWRAFCDAYFARHPVSVWKASRGFGGKSFSLAVLGLTEGVTLKADVNLLGGSGEQSRRILGYEQELWDYPNAPRSLLATEPGKTETKLSWGNTIKALMASQTSVRGPHPQRLRIDEGDEVKLSILDAALGQAMAKGDLLDQTVISCFVPETPVQLPDGSIKPISEIRVGDEVMGKNGKAETVTAVHKKKHKGAIVNVKARGLPVFRVTPEHQLWSGGGRATGDRGCTEWIVFQSATRVWKWREALFRRLARRFVFGRRQPEIST